MSNLTYILYCCSSFFNPVILVAFFHSLTCSCLVIFPCFQIFLSLCLVITLIFAKEVPFKGNAALPTKSNEPAEPEGTGPLAVLKGFRNLPTGMPSVLIVTGLTWVCNIHQKKNFSDY